ncbi:MAG TPA: peptidylprolyl isomerase [Sphingomicrobium sp.]|jgi:peptidyl-prolyl cis-trans isomerase A (cyclophilin A)
MRYLILLLSLILATPAVAAPGIVRVRVTTSAGAFVLALNTRRAPATARNFLAYVDDGRFDGTTIYRSARSKAAPQFGFIQGGIRTDAQRILPPFPHESTAKTGLRHLDGTISMARAANAQSAGGNFFICVGAIPAMDARPGSAGYAAFGQVVEGMAVVKRILAMQTGFGSGAMRGQMLVRSVSILSARRLDGKPQPTGIVKSWREVKHPPKKR